MIGLIAALALRNLPGALASETALAQRWLREHGDRYHGFDFNVGVGHGADVDANIGEPWKSFARERSQRKIDIVCYDDVDVDLMEVKGKADPCAVGQIRVYTRLWNREHPTARVRASGVICALCDDDMRFALMFESVQLFEYPDLVGVIRRT
jgi:hypothetical protein